MDLLLSIPSGIVLTRIYCWKITVSVVMYFTTDLRQLLLTRGTFLTTDKSEVRQEAYNQPNTVTLLTCATFLQFTISPIRLLSSHALHFCSLPLAQYGYSPHMCYISVVYHQPNTVTLLTCTTFLQLTISPIRLLSSPVLHFCSLPLAQYGYAPHLCYISVAYHQPDTVTLLTCATFLSWIRINLITRFACI